ncbi:MAG: hypothetical protein KBB51_03670 [Candidatus Moranbacteria bacterium]|nr:hypothetical protein [Candidatus Moranbacteria bacterium]
MTIPEKDVRVSWCQYTGIGLFLVTFFGIPWVADGVSGRKRGVGRSMKEYSAIFSGFLGSEEEG